MLMRSRALFRLRKSLINYNQIRGSKYEDRCDAHMNELPIPCIPWEPWYSDKQNVYNKTLFFGALWFFFSLAMMIYTESFYLNWSCPAQPGPPSDMAEECDDFDD